MKIAKKQLLFTGSEESPVLLGSIDFNDLNSGSPSFQFTTVFTGGKPVGKYIVNGFAKIISPFTNYSGTKVKISSISADDTNMEVVGKIMTIPTSGSQFSSSNSLLPVQVVFSFSDIGGYPGGIILGGGSGAAGIISMGGNPRNFTSGEVKIYVVFKDIVI